MPEEHRVTEGDNITCTATGYPEPDIVWLNDNGIYIEEDRISGVTTVYDGRLFTVSISMTIRRNEGGVYKCAANNSLGNSASTINITVKCKHSIQFLYIAYHMMYCFAAIPIISIAVTEQIHTVMKQIYAVIEDGNITCTATGYPIPDVVWLNNGSVVNRQIFSSPKATGDGNLFSVSALLVIRRNDTGVYTCVANNSVGNTTVNITVMCKLYCNPASHLLQHMSQ